MVDGEIEIKKVKNENEELRFFYYNLIENNEKLDRKMKQDEIYMKYLLDKIEEL